MTEAHRRHLAVSARYIGQLLDEADRMIRLGEIGGPQGDAVIAALDDVRRELLRFGEHFNLDLTVRPINVQHAVRVQLTVASVSVAEMRPRSLRGYGEFDPQNARELDEACDALDAALEAAQHALDRGEQ